MARGRNTNVWSKARAGSTTITPDLAASIAEARSFYLATASAEGQPYFSIAAVRGVSSRTRR